MEKNFQISQDFNNILKPNNEEEVSLIVKDLYKKNLPTEIIGSNSKNFIGNKLQCAKVLDLSKLSGIVEYLPEELYIKVKACTPIVEIEEILKKSNQQLAFEPIDFGYINSSKSNKGTAAGYLSCNFSGSRRFKVGSARDHILGFKGYNGKGEKIKSGGTVQKNVTGYDLSKLIVGSFGTLVVLTEITLKVLPLESDTKTIVISGLPLEDSLETMGSALNSSNNPSGDVYYTENFRTSFIFNDLAYPGSITGIRLEGTFGSIDRRIKNFYNQWSLNEKKTTILDKTQSIIFWEDTRSLKVFSNTDKSLLRAVVPPSEMTNLISRLRLFHANYFFDWGGGLVWLELDYLSSEKIDQIRKRVVDVGGYLTVIKSKQNLKDSTEVFTVDPIEFRISQNIKKSFDPKRIFNPGKMYRGI